MPDLQCEGPVIEGENPQQGQHGSAKAEHVGIPDVGQGGARRAKEVHAQHRVDKHDQEEEAGNVDDGGEGREQRVEQRAQPPAQQDSTCCLNGCRPAKCIHLTI